MSSHASNFSKLSNGDIIIGITHEILSPDAMIVDFRGSLLRVVNETRYNFLPGEEVTLRVMNIAPLRFRLLSSFTSRSRERNG